MDFLQKLMECQRVEQEVNAIENGLRQSPVRKKLLHARNYILTAQSNYQQMELDVEDLKKALDDLEKRYQANLARSNDETVHYEAADEESDLADVQDMRREAFEISDSLSRNEQDLQGLIQRLATIDQEMKKMAANLPRARQDYAKMKATYDKELKVVTEKTTPLKAELEKVQSTLPETLLARYNQARRHASNPIVPLEGDRCSGCNMELASAGLSKLRNQGIVDCENCGRIVFIKE